MILIKLSLELIPFSFDNHLYDASSNFIRALES